LILSVVGHLEKAFGVKFEPKDFTPENLANIDKIAAFIEPRFRAS
jgi:acyl carrier protein